MRNYIFEESISEYINDAFKFAGKYEQNERRELGLVIHFNKYRNMGRVGFVKSKTSLLDNDRFDVVGNFVFFAEINAQGFEAAFNLLAPSGELRTQSNIILGKKIPTEIFSHRNERTLTFAYVNQGGNLETINIQEQLSDKEIYEQFQNTPTLEGGLEEELMNEWETKYGILSEADLDNQVQNVFAYKKSVTDILLQKAKIASRKLAVKLRKFS